MKEPGFLFIQAVFLQAKCIQCNVMFEIQSLSLFGFVPWKHQWCSCWMFLKADKYYKEETGGSLKQA